MRRFIAFIGASIIAATLAATIEVSAQGTLSQQVLQLLTRNNTWVGTQTYQDLRLTFPCSAIPSATAGRIYTDTSCNLYYNGGLIAGAGGGVTPHNLLSTTHSDTLAASPTRGDIITANSTPAWSRLAKCTSGYFLGANATDTVCSNDATQFINIQGPNITGTIAAVSGVNLTNLNATNLGSGTVPLARLSGITTSQLSGSAAITYAQLSLGGNLVNADINAAAAIAYSKLNLATSIQNSDLVNATITFAKWASNSCTNLQVPQYNGASWVCKSLASTDVTGVGTVTSVGLTAPAEVTISGSPITGSGTLTMTWANESANKIFSGPSTGAATTPTFRSLVNADFPTTGVSAGSYPKVTVNVQGLITAASATIAAATDISGQVPFANGGTGLSVAAADTTLISTNTAWTATAVTNCSTGLAYSTGSHTFSCAAAPIAHNLLSAAHGDTVVASPVRGDLIVGNSTPAWARKAIGSNGTLLTSNGTDPAWNNTISGLVSSTAGSGTLGSVALPFASIILGTAATNDLTITPAAFAAGVVATVDDPGIAAVKLPLVRRGTISFTSGAILNGACSTPVQVALVGLASTSTVVASLNGVLQTNWQKGVVFYVYPTAGNVNLTVCNPTAGSITPENATLNWTAILP